MNTSEVLPDLILLTSWLDWRSNRQKSVSEKTDQLVPYDMTTYNKHNLNRSIPADFP